MKKIGILTSGGDCPGLNAAIRGVCRAGQTKYGMHFIGFRDGFRGLVQDRTMELDSRLLSGILTDGGTILGTSRDKPHKMPIGGKVLDMTDACVETYKNYHLDALVCIGGGGTQKNARHLQEAGLNVITLPKTIDNDVGKTDVSFGFDTALGIVTESIDRLHSTAMSHGRIIVIEVMGHRAGWIALGAGIAGGADVILLPEIPYDLDKVSKAIRERNARGKTFSIVVVAEGTMSIEQHKRIQGLVEKKQKATDKKERKALSAEMDAFHKEHVNHTLDLTHSLEEKTGLELAYSQVLQPRPSAADRILATRLGTACADLLHEGRYNVLVAARGDSYEAVPLEEVAGCKKLVPPDHDWVQSAKLVGTCFGD